MTMPWSDGMPRSVRRLVPFLVPFLVCVVCVVCVPAATAVAAPPVVEIRAQTKVVLDKVRLIADDLAEVRGQLLDHLTGDAIGGQVVAIKIGDQTTTATTGPDGRFRATLQVEPGPQRV